MFFSPVLLQLAELQAEIKDIKRILLRSEEIAEESLDSLLPNGQKLSSIEELQDFDATL